MMTQELGAARRQVLEYLQKQLIGPQAEDEILDEPPEEFYTMGILYARETDANAMLGREEEETAGASQDEGGTEANENQADDPTVLANQLLPASMGVSCFLVGEPRLRIQVRGARYEEYKVEITPTTVEQEEEDGAETAELDTEESDAEEETPRSVPKFRSKWRRRAIDSGWIETKWNGKRTTDVQVPNANARVNVVWRQTQKGWLVTATLINEAKRKRECLAQAELRCRAGEGSRIGAYPEARIVTDDTEERILELLYRREQTFGTGHGCAAEWDEPTNGTIEEIRTQALPRHQVPPLTYALDGYDKVRSLYFLAGYEKIPLKRWIGELDRFTAGYRTWIEILPGQHTDIPARLRKESATLLERLQKAAARMESGVRRLEQDETVRRAFQLANRAMLLQMQHSEKNFAGERHSANELADQETAPDQEKQWRAFQLAFQLLTIESAADPGHMDRSTVDLIWFPTGGGKTEAYLAVTAFVIFYRRLVHGGQGAGTGVLMRYTLRLLTTQQFRRAATLICACEILRRENPEELGSEPISIGLWVGSGTTPNNFEYAFGEYQKMLTADRPKSPFQLDRCPWCGTELTPKRRNENLGLYGFRSSQTEFTIFCPRESCPFHDQIPANVVDDALYQEPPTLLLATVDKFARMAWEERVGVFFGSQKHRAPDLIVQDELHLISGPLGTIVGVYETALDALVSWNGDKPKILASTATIRRAEEQCMALYARSVSLFPPSGLEAADSYFARYDRERPGRLYCGVLGVGHTSTITVIRTEAALLQAPIELEFEGETKDAWWTLVSYHNSLRELGRTLMFAVDELPARIKVIGRTKENLRKLNGDTLVELTSNVDAAELGGMLERLERKADEDGEVALLACTNMLSVGIDVARLGLMVVNGQPKSTAEYIQATSRVGRGEAPGLVVTVYSPTKPRDRSHYEKFATYHAALYRQVEPTSVTPFAEPARERALHAVLVTLMRQRGGLGSNDVAGQFDSEKEIVKQIRSLILERVKKIDPRELAKTERQLLRLVEEWESWSDKYPDLIYSSQHPAFHVLLRNAGDDHTTGWETLQSMRNVDRACAIRIV